MFASLWERSSVHVAALVLYGALAFLPWLGQELDLANREGRHAEIAREMARSGRFLVPTNCGELYKDKAPLFNWTVALLFRLTGRADYFLARLPSALSAIAALVAVYVLGRRWFSVRAALFAAVIWGTSPLVLVWARCCRADMMMACLLLYAGLLADLAARPLRQLLTWETEHHPGALLPAEP
jgi:4-amino-4-deoxy-L-arabinose transferase-like glycosyltransferase